MAGVERSLLAFSLGPVQSFIAAARSVRDLWTGSYLLSWLTYHALREVLAHKNCGPAAVVFPRMEEHPLWRADPRNPQRQPVGDAAGLDQLLSPCLPNTFLAQVPLSGAEARKLADDCIQSCRDAWSEIGNQTYETLEEKIRQELPTFVSDWSGSVWNRQLDSFFEVHAVVLPDAECPASELDFWAPRVSEQSTALGDDWSQRCRLVQGLLAARRSVRHVPSYRYAESGEPVDVPPKCAILGSYEQMGPARLERSRAFWKQFARPEEGSGGVVLDGIATRSSERFCAVSLVKRFAWATALRRSLSNWTQGIGPEWRDAVRYPDTHTVAAAEWLTASPILGEFPFPLPRTGDWNGRWLSWDRPDADPNERRCPLALWRHIEQMQRLRGKPPVYYAVLMLDGDHMGRKLNAADLKTQRRISGALSEFSLSHVRGVVEGYFGSLVYCGGDDVLALLPVATALACAVEVEKRFVELWRTYDNPGGTATVSGGLVVVHAKEDLRDALQTARKSEKDAKQAGRNALALTICRHSGEHSQVILPWPAVSRVQSLSQLFAGSSRPGGRGVSDRWSYRLAELVETLNALDETAVQNEIRRQIRRSEEVTRRELLPPPNGRQDQVVPLYDALRRFRGQSVARPGSALADFVTAVQAASFLCRGRDRE